MNSLVLINFGGGGATVGNNCKSCSNSLSINWFDQPCDMTKLFKGTFQDPYLDYLGKIPSQKTLGATLKVSKSE